MLAQAWLSPHLLGLIIWLMNVCQAVIIPTCSSGVPLRWFQIRDCLFVVLFVNCLLVCGLRYDRLSWFCCLTVYVCELVCSFTFLFICGFKKNRWLNRERRWMIWWLIHDFYAINLTDSALFYNGVIKVSIAMPTTPIYQTICQLFSSGSAQ